MESQGGQLGSYVLFITDLITKKTFSWTPIFDLDFSSNISYITKMIYDQNYLILVGMMDYSEAPNSYCFKFLDLRSEKVMIGTVGALNGRKCNIFHENPIGISGRRLLDSAAPIYDVVSAGRFEDQRHTFGRFFSYARVNDGGGGYFGNNGRRSFFNDNPAEGGGSSFFRNNRPERGGGGFFSSTVGGIFDNNYDVNDDNTLSNGQTNDQGPLQPLKCKQEIYFHPLVSGGRFEEDQNQLVTNQVVRDGGFFNRSNNQTGISNPLVESSVYKLEVEAEKEELTSQVVLEGSQNILVVSLKRSDPQPCSFIYIEEFDRKNLKILNRAKFRDLEIPGIMERPDGYSFVGTSNCSVEIISRYFISEEKPQEDSHGEDPVSGSSVRKVVDLVRLVIMVRERIIKNNSCRDFRKIYYVDYEVVKTEQETPEGYPNQVIIEGSRRSGRSGPIPSLPSNRVSCFSFNGEGIPEWMIRNAVLTKDRAICWIMPDTFFDLRHNLIMVRNFDKELEVLRKRLHTFDKEHFLELLMHIISLGYTYKPLVEALGIYEIVKDLHEGGWSAGLIYYNTLFFRYY